MIFYNKIKLMKIGKVNFTLKNYITTVFHFGARRGKLKRSPANVSRRQATLCPKQNCGFTRCCKDSISFQIREKGKFLINSDNDK